MQASILPRLHRHNPEWNDSRYMFPSNPDFKELFRWQQDAFKKLQDAQFGLISAFCGSGKSLVQIALAVHDVVQSNWRQKQLIIVPQQHISMSFFGEGGLKFLSLKLSGQTYEWKVLHNFCDANDKQVLKRLKDWLLSTPTQLSRHYRKNPSLISGINAIASHQALAIVWNRLTRSQKIKAIKNLTLRVDEFHHIKGVIADGDEDGFTEEEKIAIELEANNLGKICRFIVNGGGKTSKICGTTATAYRGDRGIIISDSVKELFVTYFLDWIDHFKTLGIETFDLEYEEYARNPIQQVVSRVAEEPKEKHLIIIPSTTQKWRVNGHTEVSRISEGLVKAGILKDRILDLVTPATQQKNKDRLLQEPKRDGEGESKFDVIITCMLGREGTDWCPCSRLHNTACEESITLAVQTMGRVFRRFEGKKEVVIRYYVRKFCKPKKGMTKRELLSDRSNALMVCMQLDEMSQPILLPIIPATGRNGSNGHRHQGTLADIFGEHEYQNLREQLLNDIECLSANTPEAISSIIEDVLDEYADQIRDAGAKRHDVKDALKAMVLRAFSQVTPLSNLGIDIAFVREQGFDKIIEKYVSKDTSLYFGDYEAKDWQIVRDIIQSNRANAIETCYELVEWLKEHNDPVAV